MKASLALGAMAAGILFALSASKPALGEEGMLLTDFDKMSVSDISVSGAKGSVEIALEGVAGDKCLYMEFARLEESTAAYVRLPIAGAIAKNAGRYDGLTMKVKGDGSTTYGVIETTTENNGRYVGVISLESSDWTTVALRWEDFVAIGDKSQGMMDATRMTSFSFGSREKWGSAKYAVKDIALAVGEKGTVPFTARGTVPFSQAGAPAAARPGMATLSNLAAKLKKGGPITVVALGDSITYGTRVAEANRATGLYFHYVARGLEAAFPGVTVSSVNAGVPGETFGRALVRVGHQVDSAKPDLVFILFGTNDVSADHPVERVRHELSVMLDHVTAETDADIVVLTPTVVERKPEQLDQYAAMYKALCAERGIACFDIRAAQTALPQAERQRLLYSDNTHMVEYGHERSGELILAWLLETMKVKAGGGNGGN